MTQNIEQRTEVAVTKYEGAATSVDEIAHTDKEVDTPVGKRKSFPKISREWNDESQRLQKDWGDNSRRLQTEWQNESSVLREDWQNERNELSIKALGTKPWESGQTETNINQQRRWTDNHTYLPKAVPAVMDAAGPDDNWIPYTADRAGILKDVFGRKPVDLVAGVVLVPDVRFFYPKLNAVGKVWELADGDQSLTVKSFIETSDEHLVITLEDNSQVVANIVMNVSSLWVEQKEAKQTGMLNGQQSFLTGTKDTIKSKIVNGHTAVQIEGYPAHGNATFFTLSPQRDGVIQDIDLVSREVVISGEVSKLAIGSSYQTASRTSVARAVWEAMSDIVNVKDHGAKGTGSRIDGSGTDIDTQAINNAAVEAYLSGSAVYIPSSLGAYLIDGPLLCSKHVSWFGDGIYVTEISIVKNCENKNFNIFHLIDDGVTGTEKNNRYVSFNNMSIDGNFNHQLEGAAHTCVRLENAIYCGFNSVEIKQAEYDVILKDCSNITFTGYTILRDSRKADLTIDGCTSITVAQTVTVRSGRELGIHVTGKPSDNCSFSCLFSANLKHAFLCDNASKDIDTNGARYKQNGSATFAAEAAAFKVSNDAARQINCKNAEFYQVLGKCIDSSALQSSYDDNAIDGCRREAIILTGRDSHANDNDIYDAGYETDNTYDAIVIGGHNNTSNYNKVRSRRFTEKARSGLHILSTATNPQYFGNDLLGPHAPIIKDSGVTGERHNQNKGSGDNDLMQYRLNGSQPLSAGVVKVQFAKEYFNAEGNFDTIKNQYIYKGPDGGIIEVLCNMRGATLTMLRAKVSDSDGSNSSYITSGDNFQILDRIIMNSGQVLQVECSGTGTIDDNSTLNIKSIGR